LNYFATASAATTVGGYIQAIRVGWKLRKYSRSKE
jgi:hypothetical protein